MLNNKIYFLGIGLILSGLSLIGLGVNLILAEGSNNIDIEIKENCVMDPDNCNDSIFYKRVLKDSIEIND